MVRLIFSIIFFIILALFIALNAQYTTTVNFFTYTVENVSVAAVVTITLAVGVVYSFMLYLSSFFAKSRAERLKAQKMKNKLKATELAEKAKEIDISVAENPGAEDGQVPKKLANLLKKRPKKATGVATSVATGATSRETSRKKKSRASAPPKDETSQSNDATVDDDDTGVEI